MSQKLRVPALYGAVFFSLCLVYVFAFYRSLHFGHEVYVSIDSPDPPAKTHNQVANPAPESSPTPSASPHAVASQQLNPKTLVSYAYKETENARENLIFFVKHGLQPDADFIFILNGDTDADTLIPKQPNIRIVHRPNTCFDLGSHGEVLREDSLWKRYDRFVILNASIRGPFVPYWSHENWIEAYLSRVTKEVKLVGMTANCHPRPHVQSMILATDYVGMGVLTDPSYEDLAEIGKAGLAHCYDGKEEAMHGEIQTTALIRHEGYEVDTMMALYHTGPGHKTFDFWCDAHPGTIDFLWENTYDGINVHPYETLFFKANRHVTPDVLDRFTSWHNLRD